MLMSSMREKTKVVLFIALLAFVGLIFFDWGMQSGGGGGGSMQGPVVAEVNGEEITWDDYRRLRQQVVQSFEARTGRDPGYADSELIEEETWITLIRAELLEQQVKKYGIEVSDAEILETLRTNPPMEIRSQFVNEQGQFDAVAYGQALADESLAPQWAGVEQFLRETMPAEKLQNYVALSARVTDAEVRQRFLSQNEKASARYVESVPARVVLADDAVTEADLRAWYDTHLEDYRTGERVVLEYARASKLPSAADTSGTRKDLESTRQAILDGADFGEEARAMSEDGSASRGGDLGWISKGDMVPEFEAMAFETPVGQVSPVFSTTFGFHILRVDERRVENDEEQRKVRHILFRVEASNETVRSAEDAMDDFLFERDGSDFLAAAEKAGLETGTTDPFERDDSIPGVGLLRAASRFAFSSPVGATTPDVIEDDAALWAFRVKDRLSGGTLEFAEVEDRVRAAVEEEQRRQRAREDLERAMSAGTTLEEIAAALGTEVKTATQFTRESLVPSVGRRNAFVAAAFSLPLGQRSGLVDSDRGFYVLEVTERVEPAEEDFAAQVDGLRQQLLTEKRQLLITAWLEELITEAEVVDFRQNSDGVDWTPDESMLLYASPSA